jgi:hypothetical protein
MELGGLNMCDLRRRILRPPVFYPEAREKQQHTDCEQHLLFSCQIHLQAGRERARCLPDSARATMKFWSEFSPAREFSGHPRRQFKKSQTCGVESKLL